MLIQVPVILWDEEEDEAIGEEVYLINPLQIVAVEPAENGTVHIYLTDALDCYLALSMDEFQELLRHYQKEHLLIRKN